MALVKIEAFCVVNYMYCQKCLITVTVAPYHFNLSVVWSVW